MDRRQRKTREAIISAFTALIEKQAYHKITVEDIIREADIGRATFYAHFETKDYLLKSLCADLFGHIIDTAVGKAEGEPCTLGGAADSVYLHLFRHIGENHGNILSLLGSENNGIFMKYFKDELLRLIRESRGSTAIESSDLPVDYIENHIAATFVETVNWWIKGGVKCSPEEINRCFEAVLHGIN